jgi:hypothetical protein
MEKGIWYCTGVFAILVWIAGFWVMFNPQGNGIDSAYTCLYLIGLGIVLSALFLMLEPGADKRQVNAGYSVIVSMLVFVALMIFLSSCTSSRKGYGCKGKESWNHMIKRINKPY